MYQIPIDSGTASHFDFVHNDSLLDFEDLINSETSSRGVPFFAINGGIYKKNPFKPQGLFVSGGVEISPIDLGTGNGNFYLVSNGVFLITQSGEFHIVESSQYANYKSETWNATQSGPMLLVNGNIHPDFKANSKNKKIRCGVGLTSDPATGNKLTFAISNSETNFSDFASLFRDNLHCKDALCLESAGCVMQIPYLNRKNLKIPIGTVIVFEE